MFSRYRRVQWVYRQKNVWYGVKENSRVPEHSLSLLLKGLCKTSEQMD